ncbi:transcription termination factor 4, mitochondrial isoform X1 [Halichoerus grypus]|uniref:transcription termination factor 4, mitochondrial isoform X1 n=2 Tax=Halichoerus grypus TaxID=9711 RepID=UPI0016598489|nr:transcription termination factor 4, mitochondrial isoform X1 [Halichoerus grypus]XP_035941495.1 transcription termination factor 4, mitochondrial isoform X1 [Halichoerus grypus]
MAALGRKVFDWHRLVPLTWARIARQTPRGGRKRTSASLLCKLTTASNGGGLEKLSRVESRKYMQEPECRTSLTRCPQGKQRTPVAPGFLEQEKVISSLLDMGFSDVHINELLRLWPSTHPQQLLDIISELILLGLNPEPVYVALKKSPQLLKLPVMHVRKRSSYLRKLGLGEGKLKTVLLCCPQILTMHQRDIDSIVGVLKEKCLFTVQQVTRILHRCPYVLQQDPGELEYKFQYAYFRMGVKHADVVRTDFLQYSMTKIKQRHVFLERLGRYQTPDKKGQTQVPSPLLKDILRVSEAEFLARTACSSAAEFEVFKKLFAREEEEGSESHMPDNKSLSLDKDEDEEDEEDEEEDENEEEEE